MNSTLVNVLLILLFVMVGAVFAAAEMSLVSLREAQIRRLSTRGRRGAAVARLTADPNRFLSAVQVGVTLATILSGTFGGATLADELTPVLVGWGMPEPVAGAVSLVAITLAISYLSIVVGELTAKRLAMQRAESFALALAPMVDAIARIAAPVIWFLGASTNVLVRILGGDPKASREEVTEEELRSMVSTSSLGAEERQIVDEVFSAGDISLREAMVPRTEVEFLDGDLPAYKAIRDLAGKSHSRYPVVGRDVDDVLGFLHIRDLFDLDHAERQAPISQLVRPIESLPQSVRILHALSVMRSNNAHLVIVTDEYGGTAGIVTMEDLVEELVGDITDEFDGRGESDPAPTRAGEIDGLTTLEEFAEAFDRVLPEGPYDTVAGFVMAQLGRLPQVGDRVEVMLSAADGDDPDVVSPYTLRVTELDGRRAARLAVEAGAPAAEASDASGRGVPG